MIADHAQEVAVIKLYGDSRHTKSKKKKENVVVATVNTDDVRNLIRIKEQVESSVGELRAELLIAEGNEPNGFSFSRKTEQYIAINIGMINLLRQDGDCISSFDWA